MPPTKGARTQAHGPRSIPGIERLDSLAWMMDKAFRVPGTNVRLGADAILGLLPVGGDALAAIIQVGIVAMALYRYKVPRVVAARMAANVLLDLSVGAVPLLGDVFDVYFKANTRNLRLLREVEALKAADLPVPTGPSKWYLIGLAAGLLSLLILILVVSGLLVVWLSRVLFG